MFVVEIDGNKYEYSQSHPKSCDSRLQICEAPLGEAVVKIEENGCFHNILDLGSVQVFFLCSFWNRKSNRNSTFRWGRPSLFFFISKIENQMSKESLQDSAEKTLLQVRVSGMQKIKFAKDMESTNFDEQSPARKTNYSISIKRDTKSVPFHLVSWLTKKVPSTFQLLNHLFSLDFDIFNKYWWIDIFYKCLKTRMELVLMCANVTAQKMAEAQFWVRYVG